MPTISNLFKLIKDESISYDRYEAEEIKAIGLPGFETRDVNIKEKFTYSEWILKSSTCPVVKVEGIERIDLIKQYFKLPVKDIHLFISNKTGYSFNWHKDNINVYLFVLRGKKVVHIKDKIVNLVVGQGVIIPKGYSHRVLSQAGTVALSVGFER